MSSSEKFILLGEDDPGVTELVPHTLATHPPAPRVVQVRDGVEALDFLYSRQQYARREPGAPTVVFLDLKTLKIDGLKVLRQIRRDEHLRLLPIVLLTSSLDERDVRESYQFGADAYVVKPVEFRRLARVLEHLELFWLGINHPPADPPRNAALFRPA